MARGNSIVVSSNPQGKWLEGKVSGTPKPGTCMQIKTSSGIGDDGRFTFEAFNADADGDRRLVMVLDKHMDGKLETEAYADGDRCRCYCPIAGEELNVMKADVAGTADDFAFGDLLIIDDGTGHLILTTGSPESEPFVCLEAVTDPTAAQLVHVMYTGQ